MGNSIWVMILRALPLPEFIPDSRNLFGHWVTGEGSWAASPQWPFWWQEVMSSCSHLWSLGLSWKLQSDCSLRFYNMFRVLGVTSYRTCQNPDTYPVVVLLTPICNFLNIPPIKRENLIPSLWIWTSFGVTGWIMSLPPPLPLKIHALKP